LKIVIANKYYYIDGGPERYMFNLTDYLTRLGHQVVPFSVAYAKNQPSEYEQYFVKPSGGGTDSKLNKLEGGIRTKLRIAARSIYSYEAKRALERLIVDIQPDLLYCLNIVNHISPSIIDAASKYKMPVIMRLSDYYLLCPSYLYLRDGNICTDCERGFYHALRHKCIYGSMSATMCRVIGMYWHKVIRVYRNVNAFVTTTQFMRNRMINAGFPSEKIYHIPTFVDVSKWTPNYDNDGYILYFGRLSPEKGVEYLLKSYAMSTIKDPLLIVGDGPDDYVEQLKSLAASVQGKQITFTGKKSGEDLQKTVYGAKYVVVPSLWHDNAPNVVYESFAAGKPVIATALGGLREQVTDQTGILVEPKNYEQLAEALDRLSSSSDLVVQLGQNARELVEQKHTIEAHTEHLIQLFNSVKGTV